MLLCPMQSRQEVNRFSLLARLRVGSPTGVRSKMRNLRAYLLGCLP
jgi:hypothetical protein